VTELVDYRRRRRAEAKAKIRAGHPSPPLLLVPSSVLFATGEAVLRERSIADRPVEWGLKRAMKEVGRLLYARIGSTRRLAELADEVAERAPNQFGQRIAPIDATFNGIGSGNDVWVS
jgi:hypothetical protein